MSKRLLTEYFALCDGGVCPDFLTESEKRNMAEGMTKEEEELYPSRLNTEYGGEPSGNKEME